MWLATFDAGNRHIRFDERGEETRLCERLRHRQPRKRPANSYSLTLRQVRFYSTLHEVERCTAILILSSFTTFQAGIRRTMQAIPEPNRTAHFGQSLLLCTRASRGSEHQMMEAALRTTPHRNLLTVRRHSLQRPA